MNILFVSDSPFYPVKGGADRVLYEESIHLARRGHSVSLFCRDPFAESSRKETREGVEAYFYPSKAKRKSMNLFKSISSGRRHFKQMLQKNWDVVVFTQPITAFALGSLLKAKIKVYHFQSPISLEYQLRHPSFYLKNYFESKVLNFIEKKAIQQCSVIVFASVYMKDKALEVHPALKTFSQEVIPLGVDLEHFSCKVNTAKARQKLSLLIDVPLVLTIRNLEPRMGLENLLEAWALLCQSMPQVQLLIGGEGSLRPQLEEKIQKLNLTNKVQLVGFIPEDQIPLYYQAADVFVLPTLDLEGFGLVTLEALACGTPVLGTKVGAIPEVLSSLDAALLFKTSQPSDIASRLLCFFKNKEGKIFSPQKCREVVEKQYSWEISVDRFESLLKKKISKSKVK